jgi:hypothetical protein
MVVLKVSWSLVDDFTGNGSPSRRSHLAAGVAVWHAAGRPGRVQYLEAERARALHCPSRKPPKRAVKRHVCSYKTRERERRFSMQPAKAA